jgi:hypothetical protein
MRWRGGSDAEQFRRRAEFFLACANRMTDQEGKTAVQKLAGYWMKMAEDAERKEESQGEKTQSNKN